MANAEEPFEIDRATLAKALNLLNEWMLTADQIRGGVTEETFRENQRRRRELLQEITRLDCREPLVGAIVMRLIQDRHYKNCSSMISQLSEIVQR